MKTEQILPGACLGVFGGGQLGRMFVMQARRMGYRTHVYCSESDSPAAQLADVQTVAPYEDEHAVMRFAQDCDVITFEFENIASVAAKTAERATRVRPSSAVLEICQHRIREKSFLKNAGIPVGPFVAIRSSADADLVRSVGFPGVLKTAVSGYDGKGQYRVEDAAALKKIVDDHPTKEWVYEGWVGYRREVSVLVARSANGEMVHWPVVENTHRNHILDVSVVPALCSQRVSNQAIEIAQKIAEKLDVVGVLCVECFETDQGIWVNELAPRPHNSGHWTLEGSVTNQFEQQLRAVCGLPLGSTQMTMPVAAMANLLGDLWDGGEPQWAELLAYSKVKWHDYGKKQARPGRKMGHITLLGSDREAVLNEIQGARRFSSLKSAGHVTETNQACQKNAAATDT